MPNYLSDELPHMPRLSSFDALRRNIDQAFVDFTKGIGFSPTSLDEADYDFRPQSELHDDGVVTTIRLELPGVELSDILLQVTDGVIEVSGEKKSEADTRDGDRYVSERSFGSFYRSFALPFPIDAESVDASFVGGVLTIRVPTPDGQRSDAKKVAIRT